jgi:hypothetical protein
MKSINILKLLTFLFIFIFIVFFIIFIFIVPDIKKLKVAKISNNRAYNNFSYTDNSLKLKIKELKNLKYKSLKINRAFNSSFNEQDFIKFSKKYFNDVKLIKDKKKNYKKIFTEYYFNTISKISNPVIFYKFLNGLNHYDNIIQADFPIQMQAAGDDINTTFKLKVYILKQKEIKSKK